MPFDTPTRFPCGDYKPGYEPRVPTGGSQNINPPVYHPQSNSSDQVFPVELPVDPPGDIIPPFIPRPGETTPKVITEPQQRPPKWKCTERIVTCPNQSELPIQQRDILGIFRDCEECIGIITDDCIYETQNDCVQVCRNGTHSENPCVSVVRPPGRVTSVSLDGESNQVVSPNTSVISEPNLSQKQKLQIAIINTPSRGVINAGIESQRIGSVTQIRSPSIVKLNTQQNKGYSTNSQYRQINGGLYDPYFNFSKTKVNQATKIYTNDKYLNIFKTQISYEVDYFLKRENLKLSWNEKDIHNLTNEKIALSLRDDIRTSLNNIHTAGNQKVSEADFYNTIRKHLMEGTLSEFDPLHYISLYNNQIQDSFVDYDNPGNNKAAIDAAFAAFETKSINTNYNFSPSPELQNDFKRMRFLLEDLEAKIPALQLNGNDDPIYLNNAGLATSSLGASQNVNMRIGDGAGYYFSALLYDGSQLPLPSENSLSSAYYLEINNRANTLRILGEQLQLTLIVNSLPYVHEFSSSYNPSADVEPMYFVLDLETVGDVISGTTVVGVTNPVINSTSGIYRRATDEEAITHSRNNAFNLTKINVDYRDPFVHYARDTSSIRLEQKDFNLRNLGYNRTTYSNRIMLRNLPQGIILTPGCGSYHNPLNGKSTLLNYIGPTVTRSLTVIPSLNISDRTPQTPITNRSRIYLELGTGYLGLYEKYFLEDNNGFIYTFDPSSSLFDNSYYYNGQYSRVQPPSSTRENSIESKFLSLVNKLTSLPGVEELTWWDVFRRMSSKDIGSLMYSNIAKGLIDKLSNGFSNNIKINPVIARTEIIKTGIPDGVTIADDVTFVEEADRYNNV